MIAEIITYMIPYYFIHEVGAFRVTFDQKLRSPEILTGGIGEYQNYQRYAPGTGKRKWQKQRNFRLQLAIQIHVLICLSHYSNPRFPVPSFSDSQY